MAEKTFKKIFFRPNAAASPQIPLGARSVGHYRVMAADSEKPTVKHFVQMFWGVAGSGRICINREERQLHPGEVAVLFPGMEHNLRALDAPWEYRWWTLDGPLAVEIVTMFGIKSDIYAVGPAPVEVFENLTRAICDLSRKGERAASASAYQLLTRVVATPHAEVTDPVIDQALRILHRRVADPLFGVEELAGILRLHRSTLSRRFAQVVGVSPVQYLTSLRVQNAMSLLKESAMPVAEIARQCGFNDPNYFSRLVRHHAGLSPLQFRKK
jgi:AraC-like DNA-binding protein